MVKIDVKVIGIAPLLMNKFTEAKPEESKRGKKVYDATEEAEKKTYKALKLLNSDCPSKCCEWCEGK